MAEQVTYLVDSNIWLELFLDQERAADVSIFLDQIPSSQLAISDFSFQDISKNPIQKPRRTQRRRREPQRMKNVYFSAFFACIFSVNLSGKIHFWVFRDSLDSIGVILFHLSKRNVYFQFIEDLFVNGDVQRVSLNALDHLELRKIAPGELDFDDAYQALVAKKYNLSLVTIDKDFEKAGVVVLDPLKAVEQYKKRI